MDGIVALLLSKKFTKDTVIGMGAIKGAACQVQSINKVGKTTTITLKWEDDVGGVHTQSFDIEDGVDVTNAEVTANGHLSITLSNGTVIDCGKVLPQYDTMPTPSVTYEGAIFQYIGNTTSTYTKGYFYECINDGGVYKWVNTNVQDSYTKSEIGSLLDLPDSSKNIVENINQLELSIEQLEASKLSISDIDDTLSESSENPVQNKVIKDALDEKENIFRYNIIPTPNVDISGVIIQYIGATNANYINGYYYQCTELPVGSGTYVWVQKNVQPSNGGGGDGVVDGYYNATDHLFYEDSSYNNPISGDSNTIYISLDTNLLYRYNSDSSIFIRVDNDVVNGYYNETDHKFYEEPTYITEITGEIGKIYISDDTNIQYRWDGIQFVTISSSIDVDNALSTTSENPVQNKIITVAINNLEASKLSLSDVDNALSGTSLYPVQNKVISLKIDQLQGSILEKIQKKLSATADDFVVFTNDGDITDSGISKDVVPSTVSVSNKLLVASDLSVKADKVSGAIDNDIALLDNTGNLKDSNKKLSDYQEKLTDGNGVVIDALNNIGLDISYLTASRIGYISATEKGANNGVAELDEHGKVPSSQLPSSVDSIVEGYLYNGSFYEDSAHTQLITPESNKIYVDLDTNTTYRWGGTVYVQISESLALGTTHTTAYYGDLGKTAYDHSQITNGANPHNTTADNVNLNVPISMLSGTKLQVEETVDALNSEKADKVASATNGHLAGLDANGNLTDSGVVANKVIEKVVTATGLLKDDGTVDTTQYAPANKAYLTDDSAETTIDDADYVPFYDTSETAKRKSLWSNIKAKLKTYFDTLYATIVTVNGKADLTDLAPEFDDATAYTTGQYVIYNGDVYKFTTDHSAGAWVGIDATKVDIGGELLDKVSYDFNAKTGVHQLIPYPYIGDAGTSGLTFTENADRSITVSAGTATAIFRFKLFENIKGSTLKKWWGNNSKLVLSGCPSGGSSSTYYVRLAEPYQASAWSYYDDIGAGVEFNTSELKDASNYTCTLCIDNGVTLASAITFIPLIKFVEDTYTDYTEFAETNLQLTQNKVDYGFNAKTGVHNLYDFTKNVKEGANVAISFTSTGVRVYTTSNAAYAVSNVPISTTGMKIGNSYTLEADVTYVSGQGRMTIRDGVTIQKTTDVITSSGHYSVTFKLLSNYTSISLFSTLSTVEAGDITFDNIVIKDAEDTYVGYAEYAESNIDLTKNKANKADVPSWDDVENYVGYNKFPVPYRERNKRNSGVTFDVNADYTISLDGTVATGDNPEFKFTEDIQDDRYAGMILTADGGSTTASGVYVRLRVSSISTGTYIREVVVGNGLTIPTLGSDEQYYIGIRATSGTVTNGKTIKPMIRVAGTPSKFVPVLPNNTQLVSYSFNARNGVHNKFNFADVNLNKEYLSGTASNFTVSSTGSNKTTIFNVKVIPNTLYRIKTDVTVTSGVGYINISPYPSGTSFSNSGAITTDKTVDFTFDSGNNSILRVACFCTMEISETGSVSYANFTISEAEDSYTGYTDYAMTNVELTQAVTWKQAGS